MHQQSNAEENGSVWEEDKKQELIKYKTQQTQIPWPIPEPEKRENPKIPMELKPKEQLRRRSDLKKIFKKSK